MHRKMIKGIVPVNCSNCKEKKAHHTVHGHPYGGRTMCDDCYKIEIKNQKHDDGHETEAEYQINRMLARY